MLGDELPRGKITTSNLEIDKSLDLDFVPQLQLRSQARLDDEYTSHQILSCWEDDE